MKNRVNKTCFVFLLFLVFIFSGCNTSPSGQSTGKTSPLTINMTFPDFNKTGEAKALRAVTVDPSTVATLTLSIIDHKGKVLFKTTISVTPGALVTHTLDIPLNLSLIIDATLSDASGNLLFSGRSAPHTFAKGLSASLNLTMNIVNPLLGSWVVIEDEGVPVAEENATTVLIFTSDIEYFMVEAIAPFPDCFIGMEHGNYTWNNTTNAFAITSNIVDTTGGCGLHVPGDPLNIQTFTLTIDKDTLSLFEPGNSAPTAKLKRVKSESNALIGSWLGVGDNSTTVITFINDTAYFFVDNHLSDPVSCGGTSPVNAGIEQGSYTHNAATNAFSVTGNKFDTNGGCGLHEPPLAPFSNAALSTHHNLLELTANDGEVFLALKLPIQASPAPVIIESAKPVFEAATLPGDYYTVWSDFPRNIEKDTFNADGRGIADFVGGPNESFTWEIDSQGRLLLIAANSSPTALPDRFTLVSGTINEGVFTAELDDNEDGVYETFPTVTFTRRALTPVISTTNPAPKFSAATVPGIYQISILNGDGLTNVFDFKANSTGVAEFSNFSNPTVVFVDPFTWSVDAQGVLIVTYANNPPQALPDRITLLSGINTDGVVDAEVDDNQDGVYESFERSTFTQIIPTQSFKTTLKKVDATTQDVVLTRGVFFDAGALPGTYRLLIPNTGEDLIVVINTGDTGTIKFPQDLTPNPIVWKVTADGVLRFIETDASGDKWFWTITRIANNTQNALVSVITPAGQLDASDLNVLGDFTPTL